MWVGILLLFVASMFMAGQMAQARHRSTRAWVWATAVAGPLGPLALYLVGDCALTR